MSLEQKSQAIIHLAELDKRDKVIIDTQKAKNEFEALIYSAREFALNEENQVYSTLAGIEELLVKLEKDENWLYEEGYNEKLEVYLEKINSINSTISPIMYRKAEHHLREELIQPAQQYLKNFTTQIISFSKQFPWVEDYKIRKVKELVANSTAWLEETLKAQQSLALNEDPVLKTGDLKERIYSISYWMDKLSKSPKPKDWDKKHSEKSKTKVQTNNSTESETLKNETIVEKSANANDTVVEDSVNANDTVVEDSINTNDTDSANVNNEEIENEEIDRKSVV